MTLTQTRTETKVSKNDQGEQISTTTRTTTTVTISTADKNKGQVLGGTTKTTTTVANLSNPGASPTTTTSKSELSPLQAVETVGAERVGGLQDFASPSIGARIRDHQVLAGGTLVGGGIAAYCIIAEPCGAGIALTGIAIGVGATIYDIATH
jgi:hypothetical protein